MSFSCHAKLDSSSKDYEPRPPPSDCWFTPPISLAGNVVFFLLPVAAFVPLVAASSGVPRTSCGGDPRSEATLHSRRVTPSDGLAPQHPDHSPIPQTWHGVLWLKSKIVMPTKNICITSFFCWLVGSTYLLPHPS